MDQLLPFWKSAIIRHQVVQLLIYGTALFGIQSDAINWDDTVGAVFAGIGALVAVWTIITRAIKPAPNLTLMAVDKEIELRDKGTIPPDPIRTSIRRQPQQAGRASALLLIGVSIVAAAALLFVGGCASTVTAYRTAKTLPDTAYVVTEHYAALVKEAADIAENPATPQSVKTKLQEIDRIVRAFVLGDEATNRPSLETLSKRYQEVRTAQNETDLQNAINAAVRELSNFINAVKSARSPANANLTPYPGLDRTARRCSWLRAPGTEERGRPAVCVG